MFVNHAKVAVFTAFVVVSFIMSTIGWRHIEVEPTTRVIIAAIILLIVYALIVFELVNRNLAAMIGAGMSVAAYDCFVEFAEIEEIIQWEDLETLSLLFGMMIIVAIIGETGLFDFLAVWSYKQAAGRFWLLITIISIITAVLSAFIDNVSTMLLLSPTLIKLSEFERIDPRYPLMIMAIISNVGGCATPVGDPPNLIIIGDDLMESLGITFGSFTAYCLPGIVVEMVIVLVYLRLRYKTKDTFKLIESSVENGSRAASDAVNPMHTIKQLQEELDVLMTFYQKIHQMGDRISHASYKLKDDLKSKIYQTELQLDRANKIKESSLDPLAKFEVRRQSQFDESEVEELLEIYKIKSKPMLIQSLVVLTLTIVLFFLQSIPSAHLSLGWISLFAGLTLLVVSSSTKIPKEDDDNLAPEIAPQEEEDAFETVIRKVEWSTLMFFFALFIVMEVMSKMGLILFMGRHITELVGLIPAGSLRLIGAITIILWASGIASALIDNVPFTSMMVKILGTMVIQARAARVEGAMSLKPLVFALAFGSCLGGNGTLIGASANLVTAGIASRYGFPISFNQFFKFAAPVTVLTLVVANIYLVIVFVILDY